MTLREGVERPEVAVVFSVMTGKGARDWRKLTPLPEVQMQVIESILEANGIEDYLITAYIKEPTGKGLDDKQQTRFTRKWFDPMMVELQIVKPRRILAVGRAAAEDLCPGFQSMVEDHGTFFHNPDLDAIVVPVPSLGKLLFGSPREKEFLQRDLDRFFNLGDPVTPKIQNWTKDMDFPKIPKGSEVFLDIETNQLLDPHDPNLEIISIGFSIGDSDEVWILVNPDIDDLHQLRDHLWSAKAKIVCHNTTFDLYVLTVKTGKFWGSFSLEDTMLMAHVLGYGSSIGPHDNRKLKHLTTFLTDRPGSHAFGGFYDLAYLAEDVLSTRDLYRVLKPQVQERGAYDLLRRMITTAIGMRYIGVYIDTNKLEEILETYEQLYFDAEMALNEGILDKQINWNSTAQVVEEFLERGIPLTEKTKSGNYSLTKYVLQDLADQGYELPQRLLTLRDIKKDREFLHSYSQETKKRGPYLRPRLRLTGTRTGRLSCADPNLQQVPREGPIKTVFVSRFDGGYIGLVDLSQAELRMVAIISNDHEYAQMLMSGDAHRSVAARINNIPEDQVTSAQRKASKATSFGLLYQSSIRAAAEKANTSVEEMEQIQREYFEAFTKLSTWIDNIKEETRETLQVETPYGRVRDLRDLSFYEGFWSVDRKAVNTPIQSGASDTTLEIFASIGELCVSRGLKSRPIIGVHDSILLDIHPEEVEEVGDLVQDAFTKILTGPLSAYELTQVVPIIGELIIAESWAAAESTNENYNPKWVVPCSSQEKPKINWEDTHSHYDG